MNKARRSPFGLALVATCLALSCGFAASSLRDLADAIENMPVLQQSARLEAVAEIDDRAALATAARVTADRSSGRCRADLDEAASTVNLADLLARNQLDDYDGWLGSLNATRSVLRHQIRCAPNDGIAWVRLAIVERLASVSPDRLSVLLLHSFEMAPADPVALASRIALWRSLPAALLPRIDAARQGDLRSILRHAWPPEAAFLFRSAGPMLADEIEDVLATLPPTRQHHLRAAGLLRPLPQAAPLRGTIGDSLIQLMSRPRREDR